MSVEAADTLIVGVHPEERGPEEPRLVSAVGYMAGLHTIALPGIVNVRGWIRAAGTVLLLFQRRSRWNGVWRGPGRLEGRAYVTEKRIYVRQVDCALWSTFSSAMPSAYPESDFCVSGFSSLFFLPPTLPPLLSAFTIRSLGPTTFTATDRIRYEAGQIARSGDS
ncbi:hypothetical protein KM043_010964 [Ampulex compressa]|nr:hypothetical protein KM043_010964 [Ampulex compressa]